MLHKPKYKRVFDSIVQIVSGTIAAGPHRPSAVSEKSPRDLVSALDVNLALLIRRLIATEFPDDEILCEEEVGSKAPTERTKYRWIVDPLDGTTNYVCGFPFFATAVSCHRTEDGEAIASLVFVPLLNQRFEAFGREQASLNGKPLLVSETRDLEKSLVLTGFSSNISPKDPCLSIFAQASARSRGTRRSGSAAIDICWIAAGFGDVYYHFSLSPWDVMAARHILECSGGRVSDIGSPDFSVEGRTILASNGVCHDTWNSFLSETTHEHA
jgi:myo-inositol-1(or 4)-monophosphatase